MNEPTLPANPRRHLIESQIFKNHFPHPFNHLPFPHPATAIIGSYTGIEERKRPTGAA